MVVGEHEPLVGVITALPKEYAAVYAMLDGPVEVSKGGRGQRKYTEGSIPGSGGVHRVVLALLPDMGNNSAAHRATLLLEHFSTVRTVLMVGIAGGAPNPAKPEDHVRLGDIVVSGFHGIVQYDYVAETESETVHRHPPRPPGAALLEAVRILEAHEFAGRRPWLAHLQRAAGIRGGERPATERDVLRAAPPAEGTVAHPHDPARRPGEPRVFVGVIGSADKLLRRAPLRDRMRDKFKIRAFEMESSGIADATWGLDAGYLAIRGVCDYCDDAKDDTWQNHAAVVAAAYMRALLESLPAFPGPEFAAQSSRGPASTSRRLTPNEAAGVATIASTAPATIDRASGTDLIAPLVLLQLSDLHFGPHSRFAGTDSERLAAQCRQALDEARSDLGWGEAVGLVVVTGDIAEAAYPPEYATAAKFFIALATQLALSPHRFVFVPGNYDISWTRCLGAEGQLKDEYGGTAIPPASCARASTRSSSRTSRSSSATCTAARLATRSMAPRSRRLGTARSCTTSWISASPSPRSIRASASRTARRTTSARSAPRRRRRCSTTGAAHPPGASAWPPFTTTPGRWPRLRSSSGSGSCGPRRPRCPSSWSSASRPTSSASMATSTCTTWPPTATHR